MNPLSPLIYYRRHKKQGALLLALIGLATTGLYLMVALSWAIFVEPLRSNRMFLSRLSVVMTFESEPGVVAQIRVNPDVARVVPATISFGISLPEVLGDGTNWFNLLGLTEEDVPYVLERCGATLKEGRLLRPRSREIVLSEKVAVNLGLQVGDIIHNKVDPNLYTNVVDPLQVVGILESDVRLGIVSYEYLSSHELYRTFPTRFLIIPREGREAPVDNWLRNEILSSRTGVSTYQSLTEQMTREYRATYTLIVPIIAVVAIAISLVVSAVNRIAFTQRLSEFGLLHATGHSKQWLTRRLIMETAMLAAIGWAMGIGLSWLVLYVLKVSVFQPRGHDLSVITLAPPVLVLLIPASVLGFALISFRRILGRLDAVAVVERGELSAEVNRQRAPKKSSPKPLASTTFYSRHRRRAALLISAMVLMIVAVALVIFVFAATHDAQQARLGNLRQMSVVRPPLGSRLDPGVAAQLRTHPAVGRVIPAFQHTMLDIFIPPLGGATINPYAVYAEDMPYLVELYGLELKEGHLPRSRTNEMVIPEIVAQNRNLSVGDLIGDPDHPAYPGAMNLPTPFVISGIFARSEAPETENWLAFVSLEFLESHESYHFLSGDISMLLAVPKAGQKDALDNWLENELANDDVHVNTYRQEMMGYRRAIRSQVLVIALLESVTAVVAAITLTVLNHIFATQRQSEFGILHALGYGRVRLVWRTVRETALTTGAAWGLSVLLCLAGLLYIQFGMFTSLGLRLDLFNLTPWLFTLPIPVAVLAVTAGAIAWTLSKLDPVSIIERRW